MTQTYRTDDFARWGAGQGFNLSPTQVDINFWDLIQRMIAQEARPDPSAGIAYFEIVGVMMYVHMTDGSVLGPYELPMAIFRDRGAWIPNAVYSKMDTFTINGGLWVVIWDHTSQSSFTPGANDGAGHNYYQLMLQPPGSAIPTGGAVGTSLVKSMTTDYAMMWGYPDASTVSFTPATGSTLTAYTVDGALEELAESGFTGTAADIPYEPSTGSGLTSTNVQDALDELGESDGGGTGGGAVGRQTIWIPASAMTPRNTNGPSVGSIEISSNKMMVRTLDFDPTVKEYVQFEIAMPKSWDTGPVTFVLFYSNAGNPVSFSVAWEIAAVSLDPGSSDLTAAFGTPLDIFAGVSVADRFYASSESDPLTILIPAGAAAQFGNMTVFCINRNATSGSDGSQVDCRLHGLQIFYNTNAATDD